MEETMADGEVTVDDRTSMVLRPVMTVAIASERFKELQKFVHEYLQPSSDGGTDGGDYGVIPGAGSKRVLFKSGADKLCDIYGIYDTYHITGKTEEWDTGLFDYTITCELRRRQDDMMVGTGMGSCSSYESKYRWRPGQRVCPKCQSSAIIKGREEYGGGWICYAKKGGCGAKFGDKDTQIVGQNIDRVENPDIADMKNTVLKMAKKRAKIDAVISVTRSSGIFTQDMEDLQPPIVVVQSEVVPQPNVAHTPAIVAPKPVNVAHTVTVAHMPHMDPTLGDNMAEPANVPPAGPTGDAVSIKMKDPTRDPKGKWVLYPVSFEPKVRASDGKLVGSATTFSDSLATKLMDIESAGKKAIVTVEPSEKKQGMYNVVAVEPATV